MVGSPLNSVSLEPILFGPVLPTFRNKRERWGTLIEEMQELRST